MLKSLVFALGLSTIAASSFITTAPATADDKMAATKMDCTQAGSMMSDAAKMGSTTTATGDVDKDFMAMAMEHEKGTNMMMKVEAACGKDPKMKAMAAKAAADSDARMLMFRNQGTSQ
jgi:uncharacterized protein (DUF305 family)